MKVLFVTMATVLSINSHAASIYTNASGKEISKLEAIVALANNRSAVVYKKTRVELSDKGTLKNVKESSK